MKTEQQILWAYKRLMNAAKYAKATADSESYEALTQVAMGLGYCIGLGNPTNAVEALLKGADWANEQLKKHKEN